MPEVVTWAGPLTRAEILLREAADLFERRRFIEGGAVLASARLEIASAEGFIERQLCAKTS